VGITVPGVVGAQHLQAVGVAAQHKINDARVLFLATQLGLHVTEHSSQSMANRQRVGLRPLGALRHVGRVMQRQDSSACLGVPVRCDQPVSQPIELLAINRLRRLQASLQIQLLFLKGFQVFEQAITLTFVLTCVGEGFQAAQLFGFE